MDPQISFETVIEIMFVVTGVVGSCVLFYFLGFGHGTCWERLKGKVDEDDMYENFSDRRKK
jgi:hypothetical protein